MAWLAHDTNLVLAAAGTGHGIAVISGTGSVAWGRTPGGATALAGGWGYLLGDEGSGLTDLCVLDRDPAHGALDLAINHITNEGDIP